MDHMLASVEDKTLWFRNIVVSSRDSAAALIIDGIAERLKEFAGQLEFIRFYHFSDAPLLNGTSNPILPDDHSGTL